MSRTKEKFIVLDTETCNTVEEPIPYDLGWVVCDREGNIYEKRSFLIAEVFLDMADIMSTAYYAEKIPMYKKDVKKGKRIIKPMWAIRRVMMDDIKKYKVKKIGAYNMSFDKKALNNLIRYISKSWMRWWFPYGVEYFCIWNMACSTLLNKKTYAKFAYDNDLISDAKNIQSSAECAYKYITGDMGFTESHTGLEDVKIEVDIMVKCFKRHKKMDKNIDRFCWKKVQKNRR